ncbi:MAG: HAMP domain-containing histidine kinase [Chitinophagales bacterium]|nr:HAMP domain-containing histidine kinase [Chitinophagales bacterium]
MKRRFISGIIFLLSFSLVSIIILQALWINSAWKSKREDFHRDVKEVLARVAERLETREALSFINQRTKNNSYNEVIVNDSAVDPFNQSGEKSLFRDEERLLLNSTFGELRAGNDSSSNHEYFENSEIAGATPVRKNDRQINDSINNRIKLKSDQLYNVIHQLVIDWSSGNTPIEQRVNIDSLYPIIKQELADKGIYLPFQFAVVQGRNNRIILPIASDSFQAEMINTSYRANLFPNDIIMRNDQLLIHFNDTRPYFIRSLWWMLMLSIIFSLLIIGTFGFAIYVILKQKKLSEIKTDFINNMSHEFKTPIATISVAVDAINNPKVLANHDRIRHYTAIISRENKRMNSQVENILQMALLDKESFDMNEQLVDVHELIRGVVDALRLQVENRQGRIILDLNAQDYNIVADEMHLTNVIFNLLDNANKFSVQLPEITITSRNEKNGILITVEDRGMGMNAETQRKIFEKFFREPSGNIHNVKGFGLGLSYVKSIIDKHNGNIKVDSNPGEGSRFEIYLPVGHQQTFQYGEKIENTIS